MKSMTGFGTARVRNPKGQLEVTVRSVNSRYFEPRLHLGKDFLRFEPQVRKALAKHFERGSVEVFVSRKADSTAAAQVVFNEKVIAQYLEQTKKLSLKHKGLGPFAMDTLMRLPEVVRIEADEELSNEEAKSFLNVVEKALQLCSKERAREGKAIARDLQMHLTELTKDIDRMESLRGQAEALLKKKLEQRLTSRAQEMPLDAARLAQEVLYFLDKSDVSEEIVRLREHLSFLQSLIASSKEANGKKVEFYIQELHREVNTIGSKSQHLELTQLVVQAKTRIEKLREQVQNIE